MRYRRRLLAGCALAAGCLLACGKSTERKTDGAGADSTATVPTLLGAALTAKGFVVIRDRPVPAQQPSRLASALVYRSGDGKRGGVVYVTRPTEGAGEHVGWHWYFPDAAPDSVVFTEINQDGLWDARIYFGNRTVDMIQGVSFSLLGREHGGTAAMNGSSTAPAELWKCFDGDSTTAWRSPSSGAFIEIPTPLGLEDAELDVQLAKEDRPAKLDVFAGGRKLQTISLSDGAARQNFQLDPAVKSAASIRVEVKKGSGDAVAISELEIR